MNFPSAGNDTNLLIQESFTLRDSLRFRICIEKYRFIQVKFFVYKLMFVFCVTLEYEKENNEHNRSFWTHPRITSRSYRPGFQVAHVLIIYNCVQIQKKTAFQLRYIKKILCFIPAERTDDFY